MNANHCRSDEREPPLQAIIGAAATNDEKTGRAHQEPRTREQFLRLSDDDLDSRLGLAIWVLSGGDLDGGSSSGARWRSRERCCHGGSRHRVADLVSCFRVVVVAGVVARVHHRSEWVRHRWVMMFALFMREVKGRGDPAD
ncbi:hypothetical protein DEO72_LG10g1466 [Vigna unguiculata]|uniref:Uncharacterized protein n=1 Tax=Vigna unguiculata TaxID=3917 RepID=A0A4D6NAC3_VIGUN|nr:hypothetical protein DEO72_LG10g1466 [Vigna unguiculata]